VGENAEVDSETTSFQKATLTPPLEDQLGKEFTQARRIFVDSSTFVPVNFQALSTPIQVRFRSSTTRRRNRSQSRNSASSRMLPCQSARKLQRLCTPSSSLLVVVGRPKGSKNKPCVSHVELLGGLTAIKKEKDVERSRSPPRACSMEEMEEQLLSWIPPKIGVSRILGDEKMGRAVGQ